MVAEETICMTEVPRFLPESFADRTMYLFYSSGIKEEFSEKAVSIRFWTQRTKLRGGVKLMINASLQSTQYLSALFLNMFPGFFQSVRQIEGRQI